MPIFEFVSKKLVGIHTFVSTTRIHAYVYIAFNPGNRKTRRTIRNMIYAQITARRCSKLHGAATAILHGAATAINYTAQQPQITARCCSKFSHCSICACALYRAVSVCCNFVLIWSGSCCDPTPAVAENPPPPPPPLPPDASRQDISSFAPR